MKSVLIFFLFLTISLTTYLLYSERFPYLNGLLYQKINQPKKAFAMFEKACETKNMQGCVALEIMYENAGTTTQDQSEALKRYHQFLNNGTKPKNSTIQ